MYIHTCTYTHTLQHTNIILYTHVYMYVYKLTPKHNNTKTRNGKLLYVIYSSLVHYVYIYI